MKNKFKTIFYTLPIPILVPVLVLSTFIFSSQTAWAGDHSLIPLTDEELSQIYGEGLYFRVDLSLEVLSASDTPPQVIVNTGTPIMIPTNTTSSLSGTGGSIAGLELVSRSPPSPGHPLRALNGTKLWSDPYDDAGFAAAHSESFVMAKNLRTCR